RFHSTIHPGPHTHPETWSSSKSGRPNENGAASGPLCIIQPALRVSGGERGGQQPRRAGVEVQEAPAGPSGQACSAYNTCHPPRDPPFDSLTLASLTSCKKLEGRTLSLSTGGFRILSYAFLRRDLPRELRAASVIASRRGSLLTRASVRARVSGR